MGTVVNMNKTRAALVILALALGVIVPAGPSMAGASSTCRDYYDGFTFTSVAGREAKRVNGSYSNCGPGVDYVKVTLSYASDGACVRVGPRSKVSLSYVPDLWFKQGTARVARCNGDTGAIYLDPKWV